MAKNIAIMTRIISTIHERSRDAGRLQEVSSRLHGMLTEQGELEMKLAADPNLTAIGRRNAMKTSLQRFWSDLTWFRQEKRNAGERITSLHNKLFSLPPSTRNEVAQELRDSEVRIAAHDLDQSQRDHVYLAAAEANNIELLRAFQNAPGMTPLVTPELQRRADDLRAQRLDPTAYQQLAETSELLDSLQMLARETEDLVKQFDVDVTKVPLTDAEISDRIGQMIEQTFGREMFQKVKDRRDHVETAGQSGA